METAGGNFIRTSTRINEKHILRVYDSEFFPKSITLDGGL